MSLPCVSGIKGEGRKWDGLIRLQLFALRKVKGSCHVTAKGFPQ